VHVHLVGTDAGGKIGACGEGTCEFDFDPSGVDFFMGGGVAVDVDCEFTGLFPFGFVALLHCYIMNSYRLRGLKSILVSVGCDDFDVGLGLLGRACLCRAFEQSYRHEQYKGYG
jgi:hypothetical protein